MTTIRVHQSRVASIARYLAIALVVFIVALSIAVVALQPPQQRPTTRCVHHADSSGGSTVCGKATR